MMFCHGNFRFFLMLVVFVSRVSGVSIRRNVSADEMKFDEKVCITTTSGRTCSYWCVNNDNVCQQYASVRFQDKPPKTIYLDKVGLLVSQNEAEDMPTICKSQDKTIGFCKLQGNGPAILHNLKEGLGLADQEECYFKLIDVAQYGAGDSALWASLAEMAKAEGNAGYYDKLFGTPSGYSSLCQKYAKWFKTAVEKPGSLAPSDEESLLAINQKRKDAVIAAHTAASGPVEKFKKEWEDATAIGLLPKYSADLCQNYCRYFDGYKWSKCTL